VLAVGFSQSLAEEEKERLINQIGAIPSQVLGDQESLVIFEITDNFRKQIGSNIEPLA
jgi:hypothetical protein